VSGDFKNPKQEATCKKLSSNALNTIDTRQTGAEESRRNHFSPRKWGNFL